MKVKATINLGTSDYPSSPLMAGQCGDVPEAVGRIMVARGHAIELPPEPPAPKAELTAKTKNSK